MKFNSAAIYPPVKNVCLPASCRASRGLVSVLIQIRAWQETNEDHLLDFALRLWGSGFRLRAP